MHGKSGWIELNTSSLFVKNVVLIFCVLLYSSAVQANTDQANTWLLQQIGTDADASADTDITYSFQTNSEALITLETLNIATRRQLLGLKNRLVDSELNSTEVVSRQTIHRAANMHDTSAQITALLEREAILNQLSVNQVGIGTFSYFDDNTLETAFTLQALSAASFSNQQVEGLLNFLISQQNDNGSFGDSSLTRDDLYTTYQVLVALYAYRLQFNIESQISSAVTYINSLRLASGDWGGSYETAIALLAVIPAATDISSYQTALDALRGNQEGNGSWQNDAYITALAARALYTSENIVLPTPVITGNLTGLVVSSQGGQALSGAQVEIVLASNSNITQQSTTNLVGSFVASGLEADDYLINVSLAGFASRSFRATISASQTANIGQLVLSPTAGLPVLGTVFGVVTDSASGDPVANAVVVISNGVSTQNVVTDALGAYSLSIKPGSITLNVSAATYDMVQGSGLLGNGGSLNFSPQLFAASTTPVDTVSQIVGSVINQNDASPIIGASISLSGGASATTNASGDFDIDNVTSGEYTLSVSAPGFITRDFPLIVPASNVININAISLLPEGDQPQSSVAGQVLDGTTQLPVAGAQVVLNNGTPLASNVDGEFDFTGLDAGAYTLSVSKEGYLTAEYLFDLASATDAQLSNIQIFEDIELASSKISGVVTDQDTGAPIADAEVFIASLSLQTTTDVSGQYIIENIPETSFDLSVSAPGYFASIGRITSDRHSNVVADIQLEQAAALSDISINSVETNLASYPSFSEVELTAFIENESSVDVDTVFYIRVTNSLGQIVEERSEVTIPLGGVASDAFRTVPAGLETEFELSWFTEANPSGDYQITIQALSPQGGQLLAENSAIATIEPTRAIGGLAEFDPPLTQLAAQQPVDITANIMNRGNEDLDAGVVTATVSVKNLGAGAQSGRVDAFVRDPITNVDRASRMTVDAQGNTYILDVFAGTLTRVTSNRSDIAVILSDLDLLNGSDRNNALDIDIDNQGRIYVLNATSVLDRSLSSIDIYASDLTKTTIDLNHPPLSNGKIEVTQSGDVFITDRNEIYQVDTSNGETNLIVGQGVGSGYRDIVKSSQGDIYLSDISADAIFKFNDSEGLTRFANIESANGLAIDSADNIYVTGYLTNGNGGLFRVTPAGVVSEIATGLSSPWDVFIESGESTFLISNQTDNEIVRVDLSGNVTELIESTTNNPVGLAYNGLSELFVANAGFRDIRKFVTEQTTQVISNTTNGLMKFDQAGQLISLASNDLFLVNQTDGTSQRIVDTSRLTVRDFQPFGGGFLLAENHNVYQSDSSGVVSKYLENPLNNSSIIDTLSDGSAIVYRLQTTNLPKALINYQADGNAIAIPLDALGTNIIRDIEISSADEIYLSNATTDSIVKLDRSDTLQTFVDLDFDPQALGLDETNNRLLVTQRSSENVHTIDLTSGDVELFATLPQRITTSATTIEVDSTGSVWVLNSSLQLVRISSDGAQIDTFSALGRFASIHVDNGQLYGIPQSSENIIQISADAASSTVHATYENLPSLAINSAFVITGDNNLNLLGGSATSNRIVIVDPSNNSIVNDYATFSGLDSVVESSGNIFGVTGTHLVALEQGKMPRRIASNNSTRIKPTADSNRFILSSLSQVYRFDSISLEVTEIPIPDEYARIVDIAAAPNGNIAITDSTLNATLVIDSADAIVSQNYGLVGPQGIAVVPSGDIVVTNSTNNTVYKYSLADQALEPFSEDTRLSSYDFVNLSSDNATLDFIAANSFASVDLANNEITTGNFFSLYGESLRSNSLVDGDTLYAVSTDGNLLEINTTSDNIVQHSTGISRLTDIESYQDNLFVLDAIKDSVDQVNRDGSSERLISDLFSPGAFVVDSDGSFHIGNQTIAVVSNGSADAARSEVDLSALLTSTRAFTVLSYFQNTYLIKNGVASITEVVEVTSGGAVAGNEVGDILYTNTVNIDELPIDSNSIEIDFGEWLPPIDGDFTVEITHSSANNFLSNMLHVGGSANGVIGLLPSNVFPGDRSVNGSLTINGADFTTISQINTDATVLAASSGARGRAIAGDSRGNIYAASGDRIIRVEPDGTSSDFVSGVGRIGNGLAVDQQENIYAISGNDILRITPDAVVSTFTTFSTTARFVTVDFNNKIFAADDTGIYELSDNGDQTLFRSLSNVRSIARDRFDNMYALNSGNRIFKIVPDGSISNFYSDARFEYEGVNVVSDCANNILYAPISDPNAGKLSGEEDIVGQINGTTGEVSQIFFGPAFDTALRDIDVLYYDNINQRLLMFSDISSGAIFSFPIICGGIDVDVTLITRDDVDLSSASPAPTSQTDLGDGQFRYFWDLEQVPNSGTDIDLNFLFDNLVVGEERPALAEAYLEFTNTFAPDDVIRVPLEIPSVAVEQPIGLGLAIDETQYLAFEEVAITHTVDNLSDAPFDGSLSYKIETDNGELVFEFTEQAITELAGLSQDQLFDTWNTQGTLVGSYVLRSTLFDARGNITATQSTPFEIVDEEILDDSLGATLRTTVGDVLYFTGNIYNINDSVEIGDLVGNISENTIIENAQLSVVVLDPSGTQVHSFTRDFDQLTPLFNQFYIDTYTFTNAVPGVYRVVGQILLPESGEVLAEDEATYEVALDLVIALIGNVTATVPVLKAGDTQTCIDRVQNTSNINLDEQRFRQLLIDVNGERLINEREFNQSIVQGSEHTVVRGIDTSDLFNSIYACSIQAFIDGVWETLDTDFFEIVDSEFVLSANDDTIFLRRGVFGTAQVLQNDVFLNVDDLTVSVEQPPANGSLIEAGVGIYNYRSELIFLGQDEFTYRLTSESTGQTATARVIVDVGPGISCSEVPDHIVESNGLVTLPEWARTPNDEIRPSRYAIEVLRTSNDKAFSRKGLPLVEHPSCTLSYTPAPNVQETVIVTYQVTDVRTNGASYTSLEKTFTVTIDTRGVDNPSTINVPILQLLLLDEDE